MKAIALLDVDLNQTPIGTASRLADELCGEPVLRRTVKRLQAVEKLVGIAITCPSDQQTMVESLLAGMPVRCFARDENPPAYRALVRTARKWSLDAWRGGLGGSSGLDEYMDVRTLMGVLKQCASDALVLLQPGAALVDPNLVGAMLDHAVANENKVRLTFAQTPPGLAPVILQRELCEQLANSNAPIGWAMAYKPDEPAIDLAFKPACYITSQVLRHAAGRLTADTRRSFQNMEQIIQSGADGSGDATANWLIDDEARRFATLPRELELELTIDRSHESRLHPNQSVAKPPLDVAIASRLGRELTAFDDSLVALAGHGDPLLHPHFCNIVSALGENKVYGISVRTSGQTLTDAHISALIENRVDVVEFTLDAWSPERYANLNHGADLTTATNAIERLIEARRAAKQAAPIIVPSITKSKLNLGEIDAFFDGWTRKVGCALVNGFSDYCGQLENLAVTDMQPPDRSACRRLSNRCFVASDGTVYPCDQDLTVTMPLGHLGDQTLEEIWAGSTLARVRSCHRLGNPSELATCMKCQQWHRP